MVAVGTIQNATVVALIAFGTFFLAVGTVGLLRFPNVYNRMHATSKPTTLGTAAVFLAGFVESASPFQSARVRLPSRQKLARRSVCT